MMANPYANPYANPFLNPYMMGGAAGTMDRNSTWMYLWAANQQAGGLGSGRMNTSRPGPSQTPRGSRGRPVAEMPVSLLKPGGAAGRYFNRGRDPSIPIAPHSVDTIGTSRIMGVNDTMRCFHSRAGRIVPI
jgi:hypothetical protein